MRPFLHRRHLLGTLALSAGALLARHAHALSVTVFNGSQLRLALLGAKPGDSIILAPGDYGDAGLFLLNSPGVTLQAQSPLNAVLRNPLQVNGAGCLIDGLAFEGAEVELKGDAIHLTRCRVRGLAKGTSVEISAGRNVRVSYCEIAEFGGRGISVRIGRRGAPTAPLIDHNHLHDSHGGGNGHEAIQLAQAMKDSNKRLGAVVEHNLLQRVEAESEAISVKCSGNTIRFNTLQDSRANLVNRHGEDNVWAGNVLERAYSINIQDRGNQLLGNRCTGSLLKRSIRIMGGDVPADSLSQSGHPQAVDTLVSGNETDAPLVVGDLSAGSKLPAVNTTVVNHKGPVVLKAQINTKVENGAAPAPGPARTAALLDRNSVGPQASRTRLA